MEVVLRAAIVYVLLMLLMRFSGRRTLGQMDMFDLVLVIIIAETAEPAILGENFSMTNAVLAMFTLVALDIVMSLAKAWSPRLDRWMDGLPVVLIEDGRPVADHLEKSRLTEGDVMSAARKQRGIERLEQVRFAILEANGDISVIAAER